MNINSYSGYSNSILNPYYSVSNSQTVGGTHGVQSQTQDSILKEVLPQSSPNDFNVNISQEARQMSSETLQTTAYQTVNTASQIETTTTTSEQEATTAMQQDRVQQTTQQTLDYQRIDQAKQLQKSQDTQQVQQEQTQFYQSPYGQVAISRPSIDLMV